MGTRTTAASNSSDVEAEATTCKPWSLRMASASSWVWMRVLSATTILIKSAPFSSWDGIWFPRNNFVDRSESRRGQKDAQVKNQQPGESQSRGEEKELEGRKRAPISSFYAHQPTIKSFYRQETGLQPMQEYAHSFFATVSV